MKNLLENLQARLSEVEELKYIDEDWGQLDYYSPNMPVQWPCCLIDIAQADYSNMGKDFGKKPRDRQNVSLSVELTLANLKLTNTSFQAPKGQKNNAWQIFEWAEKIHQKLHGFSPMENASKMLRASFGRVQRDDGVQEYKIIYHLEMHNV
ncbi:hypothetical protein EDL99_11320 [Ornithobacterium rhinotracheale]|uniref:hypothetical protein n=1 Tax=Ornithobacterium rhinotracheale TaxID=28251 RepID=UPI00129C224D|nr:hypothetical protein [Ornithobacterium rhinotracheale]MRJ09439.1 hypothetical protein [Ornithobacterium rhinotracheale]UOH77326.1 hypothetical protein MT996_08910 [Ornithobacterium rhinotracheale]